jgi:Zn-dependent oligopeptidase
MQPRITSITFVKNVSSSKEVRDAAAEAQTTLSAFDVKSGMRMDVYEAVKHYAEVVNPSLEGLDEESKRFVTRTIRDYRRKGLHLSEASRKQVSEPFQSQYAGQIVASGMLKMCACPCRSRSCRRKYPICASNSAPSWQR